MKTFLATLLSFIFLFSMNAYSSNKNITTSTDNRISIRIGSTSFTATLENNETARAFRNMLPLTVNMSDHNRNEKFWDMPKDLPTSASHPGTIRKGDLMLWGPRTLVLFYKTFNSSYSYTRIGRVDKPSELERALGSGNVAILFEEL